LYYRSSDDGGSMLRAFVEVDRATMGPERLAAKLGAYARLHAYVPTPVARPRSTLAQQPLEEDWKRRYVVFPRLLFVLDGTGPTGITTRIRALRAAATALSVSSFLRTVPVLAASMTDLLQHGPSASVWHPIPGPDQDHKVGWMQSRHH
jgi:hypothetical protein